LAGFSFSLDTAQRIEVVFMALYEGVLDGFSDGTVISTEPTAWRVNDWGRVTPAGRRAYAGCTRRAYVDIGGRRIRTVVLTPYQDALLQESLGQPIALSVTGPAADRPGAKRVVAMRTARGVEKSSFAALVTSAVFFLVLAWVLAIIMLILLLVSFVAIAGVISHVLGWAVEAAVLAGFFALLALPFYTGIRAWRAWAAI
jgi:hypothetical protein